MRTPILTPKEKPMFLKITTLLWRYGYLAFVVFLFTVVGLQAQEPCGAYEGYKIMMKNDPVFRQKQELSRMEDDNDCIPPTDACAPPEGLLTIPTVFHVVYNNEAENLSDAQLQSQLDVINEDFQLLNTNIGPYWPDLIANAEMEFCLATRDQYGNPTCGITRTYTDSTIFTIQTSIKDENTGGVSGWPATDYLNVFICDIANLRGYATFPDAEDSIDGIVIDYLSVGRGVEWAYSSPRFNLGRTGTHEVGHWLRLSHIWGDGNCNIHDGIDDTPNHAGPNYGCQENTPSCANQSIPGVYDQMVQNYMDYSDDTCMYLFTHGQVNLMRKAFAPRGSRVSILSSKGCDLPAENEIYLQINFDEYPQDLSWEILDSANNIMASDGGYDAGDEVNGVPPELANQSMTYTLDVADGNYILKFYDSFEDGFPDGSYEIKTIYGDVVVSGPGVFTDEISIPFTVDKAEYRFLGTISNDWYNPKNWNKLAFPDACYDRDIIIEADCIVDKVTMKQQTNLIIRDTFQLTILE